MRGVVRVRLPGTKKFVPITEVSAIPNGTEIDARRGRVLLTVLHDATGRLDGAVFYAGRFIFHQGKGKVPITTLRLSGGSFAACGKRAAARRAGAVASAARASGRRPQAAPQAVGRRPRPLPHQGPLRRRDGARHEVADRRPLRRDARAGRARQGRRRGPGPAARKVKRIRAGEQILVRARRK